VYQGNRCSHKTKGDKEMEKKYYKNYRYHAFYQRITNTTKICISILIDNRTGYTGIAEINTNGKLTDTEIDFLAMNKIHEIESLA
jgi:hypothetical protein